MEGPPPPPHGASTAGGKRGGLPDGKYDIFVIPPSSAGSGFLYLPSLQVNRNSFIAGAVCMFFVFVIWNTTVPVVRNWFHDTMNGGGSGVFFLVMAVGVVAWALGKTQGESTQSGAHPSGSTGGASQPSGGAGTHVPPNSPPPNPGSPPPPKSSWQRPQAQANAGQKSSWEKAREETRKKEEERKKAEEAKKRAEDLEKRKAELEKERQKAREKDVRERLERERKERLEKEAKLSAAARAAREAASPKSPPKRPPMPSVRTEDDAASDAYSFRPYDRPKEQARSGGSVYSESSYAPSQSTARTTPPPTTFSGPYTTKDPDKIIIKGVFSFNNAFMRTPVAQLISGQRPVTDGLVLRITTEGLFIDDDRRGEAQREWDVKAWTMKLAEVWCPKLAPQSQRSSLLDDDAEARHLTENDAEAFLMRSIHHCIASCKSQRSSVSIKRFCSPLPWRRMY
jgi:TolA-binding protein